MCYPSYFVFVLAHDSYSTVESKKEKRGRTKKIHSAQPVSGLLHSYIMIDDGSKVV